MSRFHVVGIGGSGMLPLAELLLKKGFEVSGSDRLIHDAADLENLSPPIRKRLRRLQSLGAVFYPQDGSGISKSTTKLIVSTAIEMDNPEVITAQNHNVQIVHRAEELCHQVNGDYLLAVAGTSGKSTTAALSGWILQSLGNLGCFVGGAEIVDGDDWSAVHVNNGEWSCLELDESDRSILHFQPRHAVILNITKDHHSYEENIELFLQFANQVSGTVILNQQDRGCKELSTRINNQKRIVWFDPPNAIDMQYNPSGTEFIWNDQKWNTSLLGKHNTENIAAAVTLIQQALPEASISDIQKAVQSFPGIRRRLHRYGKSLPAVFDDYAHNPEKLKALLTTLQQYYQYVCIIFQPHGYTPLRFHIEEIAQVCNHTMRDSDTLVLLPVYDAGGTTHRDISSYDVKEKIIGKQVYVIEKRDEVVSFLNEHKPAFDSIAVAGARDDTLAELAEQIAAHLCD